MKRSNILFVVALAVMVLMLGPISAKASVVTLSSVDVALTGGNTCIPSGSCTHGTDGMGTVGGLGQDLPQPRWNTGDGELTGALFALKWNAPAGYGYTNSGEGVTFTFDLSDGQTIKIYGTLADTNPAKVKTGTQSPPTLGLTFASGQGSGSVLLGNGYAIDITLTGFYPNPDAGIFSTYVDIPVEGSISEVYVPEPSLAMLLPLGLVFVGGIRKFFLA